MGVRISPPWLWKDCEEQRKSQFKQSVHFSGGFANSLCPCAKQQRSLMCCQCVHSKGVVLLHTTEKTEKFHREAFGQPKTEDSNSTSLRLTNSGASEDWRVGELERWRIGELQNWRVGELESWRVGGLEAWRAGELESWRVGDLENWRVGELAGVRSSSNSPKLQISNPPTFQFGAQAGC